jgi:hypothetical protein
MRMTTFEPFSTRAIADSLARMRIDRDSLEFAIRRTVSDMARDPLPALPATRPAPDKAPARKVRRAMAKVAKVDPLAHPGAIPATWQDLTAEQLAWWRDQYSWHSTLFVSRFPKRSPADMYDAVLRADAWDRKQQRKRAKLPPRVEPKPLTIPDDMEGYAYVHPGKPVSSQYGMTRGPVTFDWSTTPNRHLVQPVLETDPTHFGPTSRHILAAFLAREESQADLQIAA